MKNYSLFTKTICNSYNFIFFSISKRINKMKNFKVLASAMLLSAFIVSSPVAFAQAKNVGKLARHDAKDFSYGLKAGLNIASLSYDDSEIKMNDYVKSRMGLTIGAFGTLKLGTDLGVSLELLYSQQGCEFDQFITDALGITSFKMDYLNIPILLNWYVPGATGLSVKAGLQPAFLLSSSVDFELVGGSAVY